MVLSAILHLNQDWKSEEMMTSTINRIWEGCLKCLYNIFIFLVLSLSYNVFASDSFSKNIDLTFTMNIEPPVCRLESTVQSIEFGDLSTQEIEGSEIKKTATFSFTDCASVDALKISFYGDNVDNEKNHIKNKTGTSYASGIAIKLYDEDVDEIILKDGYSPSVGKDAKSFNLIIYASIEKENNDSLIQPGVVDTSVLFSVTYN